MSDSTVSVQRSIRIHRFGIEERFLLRVMTWGILLALALAVLLLRFQRLDELPPGLYGDENRDGEAALGVLQGEHAIFFPNVDQGREPSAIYVIALTTLLFGRTLLAMHLPTALGSAGMVFAAFWLGRLLFGREEEGGQTTAWRGLLVGSVSAGLMAVSLGQTILGRTAYNKITHMPLLLTLCLGFLWWGWRERGWRRVALAGACAGLLPYTYMPARLAPILFFLFGLTFLFPIGSFTWERLRAELPWAALFAGTAGLVAAPLLIHFALHPEHLFLRSKYLWVFDAEGSEGNSLAVFLINVWDHLLLFGWHGDGHWRNNYAGQPLLNPVEALLFWFGAGMAIWRWRWPAYRLLLVWLVTMMVPAFLAEDGPPNSMRILGAAPAVYLIAGVGVWEAIKILRQRYFRENGARAATTAGVVIGVAILIQGIVTYRTYYDKWAVAPEMLEKYFVPWTEMVQTLNAQSSKTDTLYLIPHSGGDYSYEYLYQGAAQVHLIDARAPDLPQKVESVIMESGELSTVKVLQWTGDAFWLLHDSERFAFLLSKYGRYQGSEEYDDFRVRNYGDVSLDRPWTLYELESRTVRFEGGVDLLGLALIQGAEQMSSRQVFDLGRDRPMWTATRWQTAPELDVDYSISLRLYNDVGERAFQEDVVLRDRVGFTTRDWWSEGTVDFLTVLEVPEDLPAGDYELRLVVYNLETLAPTVEIGVWEPETTLARLRLAEIR